jgi:hypothetical protein
MPFNDSFDPETLAILSQALDTAWQRLRMSQAGGGAPLHDCTRTELAVRIMAAARDGERDPGRWPSGHFNTHNWFPTAKRSPVNGILRVGADLTRQLGCRISLEKVASLWELGRRLAR